MRAPDARLRAALLLGALALLTGCVRMPTDGPVVESQANPAADSAPGISYDPRPPQPGQSAGEVVSGFLEAMKATPIGTSVARQFLTAAAQEAWEPERRIMTYAEIGTPTGQTSVSTDLTDVDHYDERGAWVRTEPERRIGFGLTMEDGEWRIDSAPDALVVPDSWFDDSYQRVSLYYFDPAAQILVPEPVFVPEGDQFASSLVRGLLAPPEGRDRDVVRTFFPPGTALGLSVPIEAGIADVSLSGDPDAVDEGTAHLMRAQLVWTLRQDPRVRAVELRVGDRSFGTTSGATQVTLDVGAAYDPTGATATTDLFALQDGLLVQGPLGALRETPGPLGRTAVGARSVAVNLAGTSVAAVTRGGSALVMAPVDQPDGEALEVLSGAVDLLDPAWDHRDRTWLVDRAGGRARVYVVVDGVARALDVRGITGRNVLRLLVSRDGTRLVVVRRGARGDRIVAARVQQDSTGRVVRVLPARPLALPDDDEPVIRDLAWRSPTTVSVLSTITGGFSVVRTVSVDGAPGEITTDRLRGRTSSLVSSPLEAGGVYAVSGRTVTDLTTPERSLSDLPARMTGLGYVG